MSGWLAEIGLLTRPLTNLQSFTIDNGFLHIVFGFPIAAVLALYPHQLAYPESSGVSTEPGLTAVRYQDLNG
jgi:hypothetical protein